MPKQLLLALLLVALTGTSYSANDDYLYGSSLFQTPEVKFWTFELDDFNEVRIVYQIVDTEKEFISIDGTTDWVGRRNIDAVSHISYDKLYINTMDPALYSVLQEISFGGAFLYKLNDVYSLYAGVSGNTRGDTETLGDSDTLRVSGRAAFGYDIDTLRLIAGAELVRDYGMDDYDPYYFEVAEGFYVLPSAYANWEIMEGFTVNIGFPYNAVRVKPFLQLDIGGVYDFRSGYTETAVRFRPLNNRFFLTGRYSQTGVDNVTLDPGYISSIEALSGSGYVSQDIATYSVDIGYNLPILAADLIVAGRGGYFEGGEAVYRNGKGEETAVFTGESGFLGGMSITTDF